MYRGELPTGKDRQAPVEDPYPQAVPVITSTSWMDGYTWADVILEESVMAERVKSRRFTVIESFYSDDMKTDYVAGQSYEAAEGSGLSELVDEWIKEGKVREGD
jgi:hypothetical protein